MQHAPWLTPKKTPPFASFAPGSACAVPLRARAYLPAEVIAHDRPVPHRLEGAAVERAHARAPRLGRRRRRERRRRHRSSPAARCRLPAERERGGGAAHEGEEAPLSRSPSAPRATHRAPARRVVCCCALFCFAARSVAHMICLLLLCLFAFILLFLFSLSVGHTALHRKFIILND